MSKLSRVTQLIFGSTALSNQRAQFGSLANGSPNDTSDPATIQSLPNWLSGWFAAVIGNNSPAIEDMNGMCFVFARQIAYILENGIAEYDTGTTYYVGSMVREVGGLRVYTSLTDSNTGNALSSTSNWAPYGARVRTVTVDSAALVTDDIIRADTTSGGITITLPSIASSVGKTIIVINVGAVNVSEVRGNGSETINGNVIYDTDLHQYDSVAFHNNGTTWDVPYAYIVANASVTSAKIASAAVTTPKIATNAVATANIQSQAITQGLLAARPTGSTVVAGGVALSAGSGAYSTGSTTFVNVTNLSVTITTTGRPVFLGLVNDVASDSWIGFTNTGTVSVEDLVQVSIQFLRGASSLGVNRISSNQNNGSGTGSSIFEIPPSSLHMVDFPTSGTYTYTVQTKVNDGAALFNSVKLLAYEL